MSDIKESQKALNDIRNMLNGVGEHTTEALEKIEKAVQALVLKATKEGHDYHMAYAKFGLNDIMLSGKTAPFANQLNPVFKQAIQTLDGKLGVAYNAQAKLAKAAKAKPQTPREDSPEISTTPRMKK